MIGQDDSNKKWEYDVTLSYAGEDRHYVKEVAEILRDSGIKVFYDEFEEANIWGKNLHTHLQNIYRDQARYTIMFCSKNYADKLWTTHERKCAQERAFREHSEYILPARFDNTDIPGLPETTGKINLRDKTPYELCLIIGKKLNRRIVPKKILILSTNPIITFTIAPVSHRVLFRIPFNYCFDQFVLT